MHFFIVVFNVSITLMKIRNQRPPLTNTSMNFKRLHHLVINAKKDVRVMKWQLNHMNTGVRDPFFLT